MSTVPKYHSRFGGMWVDREDWRQELSRRRGEIDDQMARDIETFVRDGVIIYPGAATSAEVDAFEAAISKAFNEGSNDVLCQLPGDQINQPISRVAERRGLRVVDAYAVMPEALTLLANKRVVDFLRTIFDADPLLFQSLSFDRGSGQGLHQDTAYVVVDRPLELAACWIALEDIGENSGELMYVRGSHRFPEANYFNGKKHWDREEDGDDAHDKWFSWIEESKNTMGLKPELFRAKKGDILIWHADLVHGGSPYSDAAKTRKSLVGHFCPSTAKPHYFSYRRNRRTVLQYDRLQYSSLHFDISGKTKKRGIMGDIRSLLSKSKNGF